MQSGIPVELPQPYIMLQLSYHTPYKRKLIRSLPIPTLNYLPTNCTSGWASILAGEKV